MADVKVTDIGALKGAKDEDYEEYILELNSFKYHMCFYDHVRHNRAWELFWDDDNPDAFSVEHVEIQIAILRQAQDIMTAKAKEEARRPLDKNRLKIGDLICWEEDGRGIRAITSSDWAIGVIIEGPFGAPHARMFDAEERMQYRPKD